MMSLSLGVAITAVMQIFLMGSIGFLLVRRRVLDEAGLKVLATLSVNICFPLFIFYQLVHHFQPAQQPWWWAFPLINIALGLLGLGLSGAIATLFRQQHPKAWMVVSGFHNAGYIPLLLATTLPLGDMTSSVYASVILSIVGFDLCLWSIGVWLIGSSPGGISWKQMINPPLVSMFAAFIVVLCGWNIFLPAWLLHPMKVMGDSALAMAMFTIGGNLALTVFDKNALGRMMGAIGVKLILMPLLALAFMFVVPLPKTFSLVLMIQACMPTAITLSIIARHKESKDIDFINQAIFYSHVISLITIPFFLSFYGKLFF